MKITTHIKGFFQKRFSDWLEKRLPVTDRITLNRNRIFIFPSMAGLAFLGVILLVWLVATNYQNNVVFGFAMLLVGMFVVTIFHSYANLAGLTLSVIHTEPAFAGNKAPVTIKVEQHKPHHRDQLVFRFPGSSPVATALLGRETSVTVLVPARHRGWLNTGRLTVESYYPLGLFRVWTHVLLNNHGVIYPKPKAGIPGAVFASGGEDAGKQESLKAGAEDFIGLDKYRAGDPLNHIAWKQLARGGQMLSKRFADTPSSHEWIDWYAFPGLDREARLSRLCHWLVDVSQQNEPFGLRLPGFESGLASGERHRDNLLRELALFEAGEGP